MVCSNRFPGDDIPIVRGSALAALKGENDALGKEKILELMQAVDDYVPTPQRALDKPFAMPVEDVFSIQVLLLDHFLCPHRRSQVSTEQGPLHLWPHDAIGSHSPAASMRMFPSMRS